MKAHRHINLDPAQAIYQRATTSVTINELADGTIEVIHAQAIEIGLEDDLNNDFRAGWNRFEAPYAAMPRQAGRLAAAPAAALPAPPATVAVPIVDTPIAPVRAEPQPRHDTRVVNDGTDGLTTGQPRLTGCSCFEVPASPVTLPWRVPGQPGLNPDAVMAVGIIYESHTQERMQHMVPYLEDKCQMYDITPAEVATTLIALHNIHQGGNKSGTISEAKRNKALSVALEMYGATAVVEPQSAIDNARRQPWVRTIEFSGEVALTALLTTSITCTAAAATYMTGAWAGAKFGSMKAATAFGAKAKAGILAIAGAVGVGALGVVTIAGGVGSFYWWVVTIQAYRDVWDNNFAKDAFFFHKIRRHHVLPDNDRYVQCLHVDMAWTSPNASLIAGLLGHPGLLRVRG